MHLIIIFVITLLPLSTFAETLQCKRHTIDHSCVQDGVFCIDKKVIVKPPFFDDPENPEVVYEVTWLRNSFNNLEKFNSFEAVNKNCEYFPQELSEVFKFLKIIVLKSSGLQTLTTEDMWRFKNLKELDVSENQITQLSSSLFANNEELEIINFSGNPLKHVGYNLLIPAIDIIDSKFFRCGCINMAQRGAQDDVMATLRTNCKPTEQMWQKDMHYMTAKLENLQAEIDARDGKPVKKRCHINKSNPRGEQNCLITGNYHPFEQRPSGSFNIYTEGKKYIIGSNLKVYSRNNHKKIHPKKFRKFPSSPSQSHHPMDPPVSTTSNSRPYTIGVLIASSVIAIFLIIHVLRILWRKLKKSLATSNDIPLEPTTLTVKTREEGRKLSSSCLKKLHHEILKEIKVDEVNCVQFDLEKCDKIQSRFDERRMRTQSQRVKGDRMKSQRVRRHGQTMKPMRNKNEEVTFFAGRSHRYMEDV